MLCFRKNILVVMDICIDKGENKSREHFGNYQRSLKKSLLVLGKSNSSGSGSGSGNEKEESNLKNAVEKTQQPMATNYMG